MDPVEHIYPFMLYSVPVLSALVCLTMLILDRHRESAHTHLKIYYALYGYFITVIFNWISVIIALYRPDIFLWLLGLWYTSFLFTQVYFYKIIYELSRLPDHKDESFGILHFLFPLLLGVFFHIWVCFVPEKMNASTVFMFYHYPVGFIYGVFYTILSLKRLEIYRREVVHYFSQLYKARLKWLDLFIFFSVIVFIAPLIGILAKTFVNQQGTFIWILVLLIIMQHILLLYNILAGNFILFIEADNKPEDSICQDLQEERSYIFRKKEFEDYLLQKKPYLKTDLKIMDIAADLGLNRTYLSLFINQHYGMNFSTFINEHRLKELNELRKDPSLASGKNMEIIQMAGFGSYQSYLRAKKRQDLKSLSKQKNGKA